MLDAKKFGSYCLQAFTGAIPVSLAAFYRVDEHLDACDFELLGGPYSAHESYVQRYRYIDPLRPHSCFLTGSNVVPLRTGFAAQSEQNNNRYRAFLSQFDLIDVAEVLVVIDNRPVIGISLLRQSAYGFFSRSELRTLQSLQAMLQLAVGGDSMAAGPGEALHEENIALTKREGQLAGLVSRGLSNKQMARELAIAPSTVKTHLDNLFRKFGVANRTELATRLYKGATATTLSASMAEGAFRAS